MTSVDGASRAQPARSASTPRSAPATPVAQGQQAGAQAMREALDAARSKLEKQGGQPGKRVQVQPGAGDRPRDAGTVDLGREAPVERQTQQYRDGAEGLTGWNGGAAAFAAAMAPANFPAPHVDPGGFAQMMADLWTRENGRGSKEVRVRFGDRAWPATGARLVRNAAGGIDVALEVGDGGRAYGDRLAGLEDALTLAGVDLGSLAIEAG